MIRLNGVILKNGKCKKCWIEPDICGCTLSDENCNRVYENKWIFNWKLFMEYFKIIGVVAIVLVSILVYLFISMDICLQF